MFCSNFSASLYCFQDIVCYTCKFTIFSNASIYSVPMHRTPAKFPNNVEVWIKAVDAVVQDGQTHDRSLIRSCWVSATSNSYWRASRRLLCATSCWKNTLDSASLLSACSHCWCVAHTKSIAYLFAYSCMFVCYSSKFYKTLSWIIFK